MQNKYKNLPDDILVEMTLSGDNDAYGELVLRYKNVVYGIAYRIVSLHYDAEDIAQDAFIDAYTQLPRLKEHAKFMPWICGIAKRKSLNHITRKKYYTDIDELSGVLLSTSASPEDEIIRKENIFEIRDAISNLSEKNRVVAVLYYFDNLSIAAIANTLDISEGTVKSRLFEARAKLKGNLMHITNKHEPSPAFEGTIKEKIEELRLYYKEKGEGENYKKLYTETEKTILSLPESASKNSLLADLYLCQYWVDGGDKLKEQILEAAKKSNDSATIAEIYIEDIIKIDDNNVVIRRIDEEAIPELERMNGDEGIGMLLFWRGVANIRLKNLESALKDFKKSAKLCPPSNIYNTTSVSALKVYEKLYANADDVFTGFDVTAERYTLSDNKLIFVSQPGIAGNGVMYDKRRRDYITYYISRFNNIFYDTAMEVGKTYLSEDGKVEMTLISFNESADTLAGKFGECMHIHLVEKGNYDADVWYAKDVGLVKAVFTEAKSQDKEEYLLSEYEMHGGSGYFPFATGNRWAYSNPCIPDYLYQCIENEVIWTDGKSANLSTVQLSSFKKNFLTEFPLDSDFYLLKATEACEKWDFDDAIANLQKAVCENSSQNSAAAALRGIDYLKRMREYNSKGYRFCPSSYNASLLVQNDGFVSFGESEFYSFSPYRYGTRFEENRIFGAKPFRYSQLLTGKIWDDSWINGYSAVIPKTEYLDAEVNIDVTDGGTVTTKAGVFTDCIKVTLEAERNNKSNENYYFDAYRYTWCGKKEFWYAKGVGIVKFDFTWGTCLKSSSELVSYKNPADIDSYMPLSLGCGWEYDEVNLTAEGYRAKRIIDVACGMNDRYMIHDMQEFLYLGTEEEYEAFKTSLQKK